MALCVLLLPGLFSCRNSDAPMEPHTAAAGEPAPPPANPQPVPVNAVLSAKWNGATELLGVGFGAEGGFLIVRYKALPRTARRFRQGNVFVIDEASGRAYREVAVAPKIGPLIARPRLQGQAGYVMLVNSPAPLRKNSVVTVVLGEYRQQHVLVQ
jgi:hypothetical protein